MFPDSNDTSVCIPLPPKEEVVGMILEIITVLEHILDWVHYDKNQSRVGGCLKMMKYDNRSVLRGGVLYCGHVTTVKAFFRQFYMRPYHVIWMSTGMCAFVYFRLLWRSVCLYLW